MNHELRRRHRWMTAALALLATLVLGTALQARRHVPATTVPAILRNQPAPGSARVLAQRSVPGIVRLDVRVLTDASGTNRLVEVDPLEQPQAADLLLYYVNGPAPVPEGRIPANAVLLGALHGTGATRLALPAGSPPTGSLMLYSGATGAVLATTGLPQAAPEVLR